MLTEATQQILLQLFYSALISSKPIQNKSESKLVQKISQWLLH